MGGLAEGVSGQGSRAGYPAGGSEAGGRGESCGGASTQGWSVEDLKKSTKGKNHPLPKKNRKKKQ